MQTISVEYASARQKADGQSNCQKSSETAFKIVNGLGARQHIWETSQSPEETGTNSFYMDLYLYHVTFQDKLSSSKLQ